jgi:hypothetical protein
MPRLWRQTESHERPGKITLGASPLRSPRTFGFANFHHEPIIIMSLLAAISSAISAIRRGGGMLEKCLQ